MYKNTPTRTASINLLLALASLGALFALISFFGPERIELWVQNAGPWAPIVLVLAKISTIVFAPLSGALLYPLAGTLFGFWEGLLLVLLGDAIGSSIAFWISRLYGRTVVDHLLGKDSSLLGRVLGLIGTPRGFFITRIFFIMGQDLMSYAAGLTRLSYVPFILIHTAVGIVPTILLTWFGAVLIESGNGIPLIGILVGMGILAGLSALAFMWYLGRPFWQEPDPALPTQAKP